MASFETYLSTVVQTSEQFAPKIKKLSSLLRKRFPMLKILISQAHDWSFLPNGAPSPPMATFESKDFQTNWNHLLCKLSDRILLTMEDTLLRSRRNPLILSCQSSHKFSSTECKVPMGQGQVWNSLQFLFELLFSTWRIRCWMKENGEL